jgi:hypothetical protein
MLEDKAPGWTGKEEISGRVDRLPPEMQAGVLRFVAPCSPALREVTTGQSYASSQGSWIGFLPRRWLVISSSVAERVDAGEW